MSKPQDPEAAETVQTTQAPAVDLPRLVSPLEHGTEEEHRATLKKAKDRGLSYLWAGELRHNPHLAESLRFGEEAGILAKKWVVSATERGWEIYWANRQGHPRRERTYTMKKNDERRWMRRLVRWSWFACFLGNYEWYRKLYGGIWAHVHVDEPCYSCMWLNCPDGVDETYREWNWRGTPEFRNYDPANAPSAGTGEDGR